MQRTDCIKCVRCADYRHFREIGKRRTQLLCKLIRRLKYYSNDRQFEFAEQPCPPFIDFVFIFNGTYRPTSQSHSEYWLIDWILAFSFKAEYPIVPVHARPRVPFRLTAVVERPCHLVITLQRTTLGRRVGRVKIVFARGPLWTRKQINITLHLGGGATSTSICQCKLFHRPLYTVLQKKLPRAHVQGRVHHSVDELQQWLVQFWWSATAIFLTSTLSTWLLTNSAKYVKYYVRAKGGHFEHTVITHSHRSVWQASQILRTFCKKI